MKKRVASAFFVACLSVTVDAVPAQPLIVPATPPSTTMRPIRLAKMAMKVKRGDLVGKIKGGYFCSVSKKEYWNSGGAFPLSTEEFDDLFRDGMKTAGYMLAGNPSDLFEEAGDSAAEYYIGGLITRVDFNICLPGTIYDRFDSKGRASVDVEWQIYSVLERKVVGTLTTTGSAINPKAHGGTWSIVFDAFANAVQQLANDVRLKAVLTAPVANLSIGRKAPNNLAPLRISISRAAPSSIADAVASTVLIFADGGFGSGFLISPDGYVLTDQHVVGGSQYLKIRWSDGSEGLGEVIRTDKARDVAVIKTDPKGHRALRLRSQPVSIGEEIYAIGAPQETKFQSSVTKGIVSATRVYGGFNFIQSDVGVTHGNSGGPIVDAKGQVVGLTDLGMEDAKMINLFIPIREAQDFLGLQMAAPK